jgi:type IX secretion system PorP/SprF family membrane protein
MKIRIFILAIVWLSLFTCSSLVAQDPMYSVYWNDKTYLNPALTGSDNGLYLSMHHRKQWTGIISNFDTYSLSADIFEPNLLGGIGIRYMRNIEGEGIQKTDNLMINWAGKIPLVTNKMELLFGVGAGIISRSIDPSKLIFSDQLDPVNGLIYSTNANVQGIEKASEANMNIGFGLRGVLSRKKQENLKYYNIGFAIHNVTQPNLSLTNQEARLPLRYVGYIEVTVNLNKNAGNYAIYAKPVVMYSLQNGITGKNFETFRIGALFGARKLYTGLYYKNESIYDLSENESLIATLGMRFGSGVPVWNWFYSYDFTISGLATDTKGVHEIGLNFLFEEMRIFKHNNGPARRRIKHCPKIGFMPEWM